MSSLLVIIFALEVTIRIVDTIGAATINNLLWIVLNYLPIETSKNASEHRKLQAEFLKVRKELNATSSQDQFAKWAKLRRSHDKLLEQLEASKKSLETSRSKFDRYIMIFRMLVTRVPQYALPFWYAKQPMFWLPYGWFPYYVEWLLSFPRAPIGSVSIVSWQLACTGTIALLSELIGSIVSPVLAAKQAKGAPMATEMPSSGARAKEEEKSRKEL
ncbi:CHD5 domain-containing protein [Sodiomyces alkalinus F11]|uniref:CHD5 domain-containing protein n=1 Tax=Sodiomyces alkalinus (strain CBS 110278 / VKM F-3762 / F11) TaxID=1314773 RepID=A0A3N2Q933_SODAK|nr:CHD5 domain-containing protein [Sodiomyces alkalinus F11]ROT43236.1 CHD5 domain-containing protein [Sodiomyces alkalinus F11]